MKVLALAAHPDDIEIGCAATIHKLVRQKDELRVRIFTTCSDAVPEGWPEDTLVRECRESMDVLGVHDLKIFDFANKQLPSQRSGILDLLYLENGWPEMVLVGSTFNSHQDHRTVTDEAKRAFRTISIHGYAIPNSDYGFTSDALYSVVGQEDVTAKIAAIKMYKSQFKLRRPYFSVRHVEGVMLAAGMEVGREYAEKFQNIRGII